jgi:hypothetical protein
MSPELLGSSSISSVEAGQLSNLTRHELEHAVQWWHMARLRAGQGHDAAAIARDMEIPLAVAADAVAAHGRDGPLTGQDAQEAQVWWDSVYGDRGQDRSEMLLDREHFAQRLDDVQLQIDAQGANPDPTLLAIRDALTPIVAAHDRAYRGLAEEGRAYEVGDRTGAEATVMEIERQADLAEIAAEHARETVRDLEAQLLDDVAAGREPDPRTVRRHDAALERLRGLEDRADDLAAQRDAMTDESAGGAGPLAPAAHGPGLPGSGAAGGGAAPVQAPPGSTRRPPGGPVGFGRVESPTGAQTSEAGLDVYQRMRRGTPLKECMLVLDPSGPAYYGVQGGGEKINIAKVREQGMIVLRHSHPNVRGTDAASPGDNHPSTEDMGELAIDTPPGQRRTASIDFDIGGGRSGHADYHVDKRRGRIECGVEIYHDGELVFRDSWPDITDYQRFLSDRFGAPGTLPEGSTQLDPDADDEDY